MYIRKISLNLKIIFLKKIEQRILSGHYIYIYIKMLKIDEGLPSVDIVR